MPKLKAGSVPRGAPNKVAKAARGAMKAYRAKLGKPTKTLVWGERHATTTGPGGVGSVRTQSRAQRGRAAEAQRTSARKSAKSQLAKGVGVTKGRVRRRTRAILGYGKGDTA